MSNARDKANIPALNFSSTGIDDNATSTAVTIDSSGDVGINNTAPNLNPWNKAVTLSGTSNCAYELAKGSTLHGALGLQGDNRLQLINFQNADITFNTGTSATERMRITSTGLGIGTSSPEQKLDVNGIAQIKTTTSGTRKLRIKDSVTSEYFDIGVAISSSQPNLTFSDGASERMRIDSSGNVGIGVTPGSTSAGGNTIKGLVLGGNANNGVYTGLQILNRVENSTTSNGIGIDFDHKTSGATTIPLARIIALPSSSTAGNLRFYTSTSSSLSEAMRIDNSGNLLVGTTTSGYKLNVNGISNFSGYSNWTSGSHLYWNGGDIGITNSGQNMLFKTYSSGSLNERMRITSAGSVGIGTNSPSGSDFGSNTGLVHLKDIGANNTGIKLEQGAGKSFWYTNTANTFFGTTTAIPLRLYTNNTERMRIDSSGNVLVGTTTAPNIAGAIHVANSSGHGLQITNTSASKNRRIYMGSSGRLYFWNGTNEGYLSDAGAWTNASDERLKNNIRNIEYGLNTVLSTKPRHYERNDVEGTYIGFVAQELQNIIPEVVSGNPDKQLGIDYGSLVAVSFKAIQEQQTIIQELEARITALETNNP